MRCSGQLPAWTRVRSADARACGRTASQAHMLLERGQAGRQQARARARRPRPRRARTASLSGQGRPSGARGVSAARARTWKPRTDARRKGDGSAPGKDSWSRTDCGSAWPWLARAASRHCRERCSARTPASVSRSRPRTRCGAARAARPSGRDRARGGGGWRAGVEPALLRRRAAHACTARKACHSVGGGNHGPWARGRYDRHKAGLRARGAGQDGIWLPRQRH